MELQSEFQVLGQKIVVKTKEEAELAEMALEIVNRKVEELKNKATHLATHQVYILALVEVASDLVKDRKMIDNYRHELDVKCSYLLAELGQSEKPKNKSKVKAV